MTDLESFAAANKVLIHPRVYSEEVGGPDKFMEQFGGRCPVLGDFRSCPCPESLEEIQAPDPMNQHCVGWVIITEAYLKAIDPRGKIYSTTSIPSASPAKVLDSTDEVLRQYSLGVGDAVTAFRKDDFESAFDKLVEMADSTDCEVCKEVLTVAAIHVNSARNMCDLPYEGACSEERARVAAELAKVQKLFAGEAEEKKADKPKSEYREKVTEWLNSSELAAAVSRVAKPEFHQKIKFSMAAKLAGGKADTIDDAMDIVVDEHPGWF